MEINGSEEELELELDEKSLAQAQVPLEPQNNSESTHTLCEAPLPPGASLATGNILEPVISLSDDTGSDNGPPPYFQRLSVDQSQKIVSKSEGPMTWSLTRGELWPVFVARHYWPGMVPVEEIKKLALTARRYAGNRVVLGPYGEIDLLFNDRESLEKARDPNPVEKKPWHIMNCRGLMFCPLAARDTQAAAKIFLETFSHYPFSTGPRHQPVLISIAGCGAGCGQNCGLYEYSDIKITGGRKRPPVINQDLLKLSPRISELILGCPGEALQRGKTPENILDIHEKRCLCCGWCLSVDPSFSLPTPQDSYFSLLLSGRRLSKPYSFVIPELLVPELPEELEPTAELLASVIEHYRQKSGVDEIFYDFFQRMNLEKLFQPKNSLE